MIYVTVSGLILTISWIFLCARSYLFFARDIEILGCPAGLVLPQKEKVPLIDQPRIPSFPIELVKTKSDFIVRLVEMGLGRWVLVVAVISVDANPFLAFFRLGLSPWV